MGGTTKQASGAAATENALATLTAERDAALARVAELEKDLAHEQEARGAEGADRAALVSARDEALAQVASLTVERDGMTASIDHLGVKLSEVGLAVPAGVGVFVHICDIFVAFLGAKASLEGITQHIVEHGLWPAEDDQPLLDVVGGLIAGIPDLKAERDQAVADLAAAAKAHDKTKGQLKVAKAAAAPRPAKPRAIGPLPDGQWAGEALLTAIAAAETVELVFSDGERELVQLAPQRITGDAWYLATNGVRLRIGSLPAHGLGHGEAAYQIAGFGLLLDGKLAAYAARMDRLTVQPGTRHELKDDVIFA